MRKVQLIKKVLKAYKEHIKYIQENFQDIHISKIDDYLGENNLHCGICMYISRSFPENYYAGYYAKWIKKYSVGAGQWGPYPINGRTVQEVLTYLQTRVDNMERELQEGDKLQQRLNSKQYYVEGFEDARNF